MRGKVGIVVLGALLTAAAPAGDEALDLPTPQGWHAERIPFPLEFAPSIPYRGIEEVRLQKGVFDPASDAYFHYVFAWSLEGAPALGKAELTSALRAYYAGLLEKKKEDEVAVRVRKTATGFEATVKTAFEGNPLELDVEITTLPCGRPPRTIAFFLVSPKPPSDDAWKPLRALRDGFHCP